MTKGLDISEALVIHGVGPDFNTDPFAFCYPAAPPSNEQGSYVWREWLAGWASRSSDKIHSTSVEIEVGDRSFEFRNKKQVAELFSQIDRTILWRLESDWSASSTSVPATLPAGSDDEIHHVGNEAIRIVDALNGDVERGVRGTEPVPHAKGTFGYKGVPYWRGRTCELITWTRGRGIETWWRGSFPLDENETSPDSTVFNLTGKGALSAFLEADIPESPAEGKPKNVWTFATQMPPDSDGDYTSDYLSIGAREPNTTKGGLQRDGRVYVDDEGRVWAMANFRTGASAGAAKRHPPTSSPIELEDGVSPSSAGNGTLDIGLREIFCFGDYFDIPEDNQKFGVLSGTDLEGHIVGPMVAFLRSIRGFEITQDTYDVARAPWALQANQLVRSTDVQVFVDFAKKWPEFTLDHFLVGLEDESFSDVVRRAARMYGVFVGVSNTGGLKPFRDELPRIDESKQPLAAHHVDDPKIKQQYAGAGVEKLVIKYGSPTDAKGWRGSRVTTTLQGEPSGPKTFVNEKTDAIDANALEASDQRVNLLMAQAVERIATGRLNTMVIRVPWNEGPFALGETIKVVSLNLRGDVIVRQPSGERGPVTISNPLYGKVIGKRELPNEAGHELQIRYREDLVRLRAPAGWITGVNSGAGDDTLTLHPDPQWGNDVPDDSHLFEPGDDIVITDRHFKRMGSGFELASVDTSNRQITISGTFGLGDISKHVVRVADYDVFSNASREDSEGSSSPWTYLADADGTIGTNDDPAHPWG